MSEVCCVPTGCPFSGDSGIDLCDSSDGVRVLCSNDKCHQSGWIHAECFQVWEQNLLDQLRAHPKARIWPDCSLKQNLWYQPGYELIQWMCKCTCQRGFLRRDLNAIQQQQRRDSASRSRSLSGNNETAAMPARPLQNQQHKPSLSIAIPRAAGAHRHHNRQRTISFNGSFCPGSPSPDSLAGFGAEPMSPHRVSPADSAISEDGPAGSSGRRRTVSESSRVASGSIFPRRQHLKVFDVLPRHRRNGISIKLDDDEGPFGNDDTRLFVLSRFSMQGRNSINCVLCARSLCVYDRYPLIDGTLYLSPVAEPSSIAVRAGDQSPGPTINSDQWLSAVCMWCLNLSECDVRCRFCDARWMGSTLVLGTMYAYDVFSAQPCCRQRLTCKACAKPLDSPEINGHRYYSSFTKQLTCYHCLAESAHFVRPLNEVYKIHVSTWATMR